jgi:hypothetical protein
MLFTLPSFLLLSILSLPEKLNFFGTPPCSIILWWQTPRYVAETATFPRMDGFVGTNEVRIFRPFSPHIHSHFIYLFSLVLFWTFIPSMALRIARTTHLLSQSRIGTAAVSRLTSRCVPLWLSSRALATAWSRGLPAVSMCFVSGQPAHPLVHNPFLSASYISMAFIGPNVFRCPSIFTSFSARDWTSLRESFTPLIPLRVLYCRCVHRRGPSPFHFGLDTIR